MLDSSDMEYMSECLDDISPEIEEEVTYRRFDHIEPGDSIAGIPDTVVYNEFGIKASVRELTLREVQVSGGVYVLGDMQFFVRNRDWMQVDVNATGGYDPSITTPKPDYQDLIVYCGSQYKPKNIGHSYLGSIIGWTVRASKV